MSEAVKEKCGKTERGKEACPCHLKKCGKRRKENKENRKIRPKQKIFRLQGWVNLRTHHFLDILIYTLYILIPVNFSLIGILIFLLFACFIYFFVFILQ